MLNSNELHKDDNYKNKIIIPIESSTLHQPGQQNPSKGRDLALHEQKVRINLVKMQIQPSEEEEERIKEKKEERQGNIRQRRQ